MTQKMRGPYPGVVLDVHDGDTMTLNLDLGFGFKFEIRCRVFGINAPELSTAKGKSAAEFLQEHVKVGDDVSVISHGWDKYGGRFDGTVNYGGRVMVAFDGGTDVATLMLNSGNAVVLR